MNPFAEAARTRRPPSRTWIAFGARLVVVVAVNSALFVILVLVNRPPVAARSAPSLPRWVTRSTPPAPELPRPTRATPPGRSIPGPNAAAWPAPPRATAPADRTPTDHGPMALESLPAYAEVRTERVSVATPVRPPSRPSASERSASFTTGESTTGESTTVESTTVESTTDDTRPPASSRSAPVGATPGEGDVDTPPRGRSVRPPNYPRTAAERGLEGWVTLFFRIDATGRVRSVTVIASDGDRLFEEAAVRAARSWTFEPAREGGRPVPVMAQRTIHFRAPDRSER